MGELQEDGLAVREGVSAGAVCEDVGEDVQGQFLVFLVAGLAL